MFKKGIEYRILGIIAFILIVGMVALFIIARQDTNQKQVKGVFVMLERGEI